MAANPLDALFQALDPSDRLLILPHNDPDPDAIASAAALQYLLAELKGLNSRIRYSGIIGRAENKALVQALGHPLAPLSHTHLAGAPPVALIDTQPGAGNHALPESIQPLIVIDHHPQHQETGSIPFADIRPTYGATSTILTEYLRAAELEPPPPLATALFYGIKTDTMGLGRDTCPADVEAYFFLQQHLDVEILTQVEQAQVPADYFISLVQALRAAHLHNSTLVTFIPNMHYPDLAAEIADFLLRLHGVKWVISLGQFEDTLILAVRTRSQRRGAGRLARLIVGGQGSAGGHGAMAGGQIPLYGSDAEATAQRLIREALANLNIDPSMPGKPLLAPGDVPFS
jgi:nanoRNase/pAp phosphatase (c-di-AMP/oligoRNAs hydrolase)